LVNVSLSNFEIKIKYHTLKIDTKINNKIPEFEIIKFKIAGFMSIDLSESRFYELSAKSFPSYFPKKEDS